MDAAPLYAHDCARCRYLGTDLRAAGEPACNLVDLYVCEGPTETTLIRRYSSEPSNHGAMSADHAGNRYAEAMRRAGLQTAVHRRKQAGGTK
jgi:hypothetical protein